MTEIVTMGEMLCEIMRPETGVGLDEAGIFKGPFPSGAPAIFIDTASRLGHSAAIISGVGKDDFGKCLLTRLKNDGVNCSHVLECEDGSTGVAFVTYFEDGSRKFLYHFSNTPATAAVMPDVSSFGQVKYFHIMGCSLMASRAFGEEILKTMRAFKAAGSEISFDPNIREELLKDETALAMVWEVMENCSVFLPGVPELIRLTGIAEEKEAVETCFRKTEMEIIVVKDGSRGSRIYTRRGQARLGVYPARAVDSTGAGDSFDAAFLCGLLSHMKIQDAARYASAAAALNTEAFGPMEGNISEDTVRQKMQEGMV